LRQEKSGDHEFCPQVISQLVELTAGIESFHRNTLKKVEQLILSEVPKALFFATDNHEEIAARIAEHHLRWACSSDCVTNGAIFKIIFTKLGGRCYDHNFLRFLPIFGEKISDFLKSQCYDQNFA
jgi:hypothetical protein